MAEWQSMDSRIWCDGDVVDLWHPELGRLPGYRYYKDYCSKGNNFFDPISSGYTCIRDATHWMPIPAPPDDSV